jgi:membrane-associated phospholipid phosphatase
LVANTLGGANRETGLSGLRLSQFSRRFFACGDPPSVASRSAYIAQGDNMHVRSSLLSATALRTTARIATALVTLAFLTACATDKPDPTGLNPTVNASRDVGPAAEVLASPGWQATARTLVSGAAFSPINAGHAYPLLGVAQYLAVQRAEAAIRGGDDEGDKGFGDDNGDTGSRRSATDRGAVAGASVVALSYLFPNKVQMLEDMVTAQANGQPPAFAAGEAIGRVVGAEIVTRAIGDGFSISLNPAPPVGPGFWTTNAPGLPVAGGQFPGITPWFLNSAHQFRPGPPPAFGSADFNTALAEIRHISDTRTALQTQIAAFWALNAGTPTASGFWLSVPTDSGWVANHHLSERQTTHLYALLSATMMDATIGCWDAKLTYWLIRPWKADPGITVVAAVGKPNHPSYPSGHSCVSSSAASVLTSFFPEKRAQLDAMVVQAGLSRMYGGIHYRFDIEAGQQLGRSVAQFTIKKDASGKSVLTDKRDDADHERGDGEHKGGDDHR